jgi:hypothetical protein
MRVFAVIALVTLGAMLAGCGSEAAKPDANYAAYLDLYSKQQKSQDDQRTAFSQMAAKCTSDACVTQVAAIAALAASSGGHAPTPQPYQKQESTAAKFGLALVGQISPLAAAAVSWHSQDTSKAVSLAQYQFLGGSVHDLTQAAASVAPTITVGRDYIPGNVDNGTHVTGDLTNGNKTTTTIDNSGVYNTGTIDRYQSPSDDHTTSGDACAGSTTCQTQPPPPAKP